jgi:hypothetical protein
MVYLLMKGADGAGKPGIGLGAGRLQRLGENNAPAMCRMAGKS